MFFDNKKRTARLSDSSCTVVTKTVHHCDRSKNDHSINNIVKLTGIPQNNIDYEMIVKIDSCVDLFASALEIK